MHQMAEPPENQSEKAKAEEAMGPSEVREAFRNFYSGWEAAHEGKARVAPFKLAIGKNRQWREGYDAAKRSLENEKAETEAFLVAIEGSSS